MYTLYSTYPVKKACKFLVQILYCNLAKSLILFEKWILAHLTKILHQSYSDYRILQIVRGGKVSLLQDSTVIRWKTFVAVPHSQLQLIIRRKLFHWKFRSY